MYYSYLLKRSKIFSLYSFFFTAALFSITFLTACNNPNVHTNANVNELTALQPIDKHYKTLSEFSKSPNAKKAEMDRIKFPSKKYAWLATLLNPAYTTDEQLQRLTLSLQPPANSSDQSKADLEFLLDLQKNRTKQQAAEALRMNEIVYVPIPTMQNIDDLFFECFELYGNEFEPKNYPATKKLLRNAMKEIRIIEFRTKNHFLRPRPRQLESKLEPLVIMTNPSFASGHTLWAYMQAYLFAELNPTHKNDFLNLAYEIGYSREVLGVHYPSDEEAARVLSYKVLELMWKSPNFQNDFSEAKKEWVNFGLPLK